MECRECGSPNDADAAFCVQCGRPVVSADEKVPARQRKAYVYALLILPVLLIAAAVGYYKFFLPEGVAAVVNGEEIKLSELEAAVSQVRNAAITPETRKDDPVFGRMRYQVLNQLITERIALQEARKAGLRVSGAEVADAAAGLRAASGLDEAGFARSVAARYGSARAFEQKLERDLLIRKFIAGRVVPAGADPESARAAMSRWLQKISRNASVRIALAEQWSAAGCSCCSGGGAPRSGMQGAAGNAGRPSPGDAKAAADAGLRYWNGKYGGGAVTARTTDFGCHIQVDILHGNKIVQSLRYQDGIISEM
jgi:hypothetical protein